ncbi:MAG: hypothetical protein OXU64_03015 [Gemmatimonadota bacterium]|nr:hypothetical protein [Deltaproteobacteria bacterium]MDE2973684.1 hypothetical protein [Gemmatimonadota bacterium]
MPPEIAQWIVPLIVVFGTLSPAVIVGLLLYIHRSLRQDMREMRSELHAGLREAARERTEIRDRIGQVEASMGDRMGRIEGRLDELREFFFRTGGTAA